MATIASRLDYLKIKARSVTVPTFIPEKSGMKETNSETREKTPDVAVLVIRDGENHRVIPFTDIRYLSAHGRKSIVHTVHGEYESSSLLKELNTRLSESIFCRVHKSFIVNINYISHIQYNIGGSYIAFLKDEEESNLPVGRSFAGDLKSRLGMKNS
jgi:two-component system response regulator LytT